MRSKIILVNGTIVLVLTMLWYFLLSANQESALDDRGGQNARLARALNAANAQLSLDALRMERFLAEHCRLPRTTDVFRAGTAQARQESATAEANRLREVIASESRLGAVRPSLVLVVDSSGLGLGRNGSELMRGDPIGRAYPALLGWLRTGRTGSDVWVSHERQEQMLVSFAPVVDAEGTTLGGVVVGSPLNDERMAVTAELVSGGDLALLVDGVPVANGGTLGTSFPEQATLELARRARPGSVARGQTAEGDMLFAAAPLLGYSSQQAVLAVALPQSVLPGTLGSLWPILAIGALGLFLVLVAAIVLGNYISRPVAELEDGLLRVINGEEELRFELDHDELGGLSTRINTLLNAVQGIHEEDIPSDRA